MTGTPLDLTPFGHALAAIGWLYWLIALAILVFAWWLPNVLWQKFAMVSVAMVAVYFVFVQPVQTHVQGRKQQHEESNAKLDEAMALFKKRCEAAGEKITRVVENVEGVVWMKWRPKEVNLDDQFRLNDPYGHDCYGDECITRLLRVDKGNQIDPEIAKRHTIGYRFVETIDPADGKSYRYRGAIAVTHQRTQQQREQYIKNTGSDPGFDVYDFALVREPVETFTARFGVTWEDLSTNDDRMHWIAGSSLKLIDLQTKEVIAERVGYIVDRGLGSKSGFRSPWPYARDTACPSINSERTTWAFSTKVLQPIKQ